MNEWTDAISGTNIIQEFILTFFICIDFHSIVVLFHLQK